MWGGEVREKPVSTGHAPLGNLGHGMPCPYILGSSGFLVGGQRVAGSSILPTRRRPQSHRSPKGGQEIPKYPTRQSGRGQLVKGIRH